MSFESVFMWACGLLLAGVLVVAGCAIHDEATEPETGVVTAKEYHAAWTQMSCAGKPLICTPIHHPECWEVRYHNESAGRGGDACVPESDYRSRYPIGAPFPEGVAA